MKRGAAEQKMDIVIQLLQHLVAVQLFQSNVPKGDIAKHLHVAKSKVVKMLKYVSKER